MGGYGGGLEGLRLVYRVCGSWMEASQVPRKGVGQGSESGNVPLSSTARNSDKTTLEAHSVLSQQPDDLYSDRLGQIVIGAL